MISILMPVYNEKLDYLKLSINSMLSQTYLDFELLIGLDNPENIILKDYLDYIKQEDNRIQIFINKSNIGLTKNLNKLLAHASGKYIARMDADDIASKNRLMEQVKYIEKEKLDLVATNVVDINESGNLIGTGTNYPTRDKYIKKYLLYGDCMPHPTWLGRAEIFNALNGYRDINACEDYDFLLRGALKGVKYGVISTPLLKYRINTSGISQKNYGVQLITSLHLQSLYKAGKLLRNDDLPYKELPSKLKNNIDGYRKFKSESTQCRLSHFLILFLTNSLFRVEVKNSLMRKIYAKKK